MAPVAGVEANGKGLGPLEPRRVEAVEPAHARVGVGPLTGKGAQVTGRTEEIGDSGDFAGADRQPAQRGLARQQGLDLRLAFLRFQGDRRASPDDPAQPVLSVRA